MALSPSHRGQNGFGYPGGGSPGGPAPDKRYSVQSLRSSAKDEVAQLTQFSPVDILLNRVQESNQKVQSEYSSRQYDRAFVEWLKSDAVLAMLPNHADFPYLRADRKERYSRCRKDHEAQRPIYEELENIVEGRNARASSVTYASASPPGPPRAQSVPNGAPPSSDPLLTRFSQLRMSSGSSPSPGPSPKLPYPTGDNTMMNPTQHISSQMNGVSRPTNANDRLVGPRQMPPPAYSPMPPPKQPPPVDTSLPRAPDPVYSPSKNIGPTSNAASQKPAPPPPPPPRHQAAATARPLQMPQPQPFQYNGPASKPVQRSTPSPRPPEVPRPPLPQGSTITAEALFQVFKAGHKVLIVDVRSRELFDEGHIHSKSIVCIDPLILKYGMSFDQLIESLVLSPDPELDLLETIGRFDLVVYYDEMTSNERFLRGAPASAQPPGLRALHDTLVEFNDRSPLRQIPALLVGGLNAWMDLVGPNALQTSNTLDIPKARRLPKPARPPARRISIANNNSSREIRRRRLAHHRPLNAEEEREWTERLRQERIAEATPNEEADAEAARRDDPSVDMIHTYDDFFRRFPSVEQQSMTTPKPPKPPPRAAAALPSVPSIPSRPEPAVSRPSYSGVSDREPSQNSLSRQSSASQPPLYISRSVPQALRLPRTGLKNFSNTCYMNATIQCLQATTPLLAFFLNDGFHHSVQKNPRGSDGILPNIFANLLRGLWRNSDPVVRPVTLQKLGGRLREDWANVGVQQDAKEYFDFLIDILHEDLNINYQRSVLRELTDREEQVREKMALAQASKIEWDRWSHRESSAISHFFFGQHASRLRCTTCRQTSTRYEPFTSLAIEIPVKGPTTLAECLRNYCKEEMLDTGEEWMCPHCKCRRQATKQILITRVPQILTIHLKRFLRVDRTQHKIQTVVEFPLHGLDVGACVGNTFRRDDASQGLHTDWAVTPPFTFDAFAVMRHHGPTIMSGHYTAVVKDKVRNTWVNFNDERVTEVDPARLAPAQRLQNSEAYILFYERVKPR